MSEIKVSLGEAKAVFFLLEKIQDSMHQPLNYRSIEQAQEFISSVYPEVREAYYKTVWHWLPPEVQKQIEEL